MEGEEKREKTIMLKPNVEGGRWEDEENKKNNKR